MIGGVRSGSNTANLFIKTLPNSLTLNTVDQFVLQYLDRVKIPWAIYVRSCQKIITTSSKAVFSEEVIQLLHSEPYTT